MRKSILLFIALWIVFSSDAFSQYLSFTEGLSVSTEQKTLPERSIINGGASYFEIVYNFTGAYLAETFVEGEKYQFINIEGFAKMQQVGAPALPAYNEIIAMPAGSEPKIIITDAHYYEYDGFSIHPALEPARDTEGAPGPEFQKDEAIYGTDEYFPQNIIDVGEILMSRGTPLAVTQVRPVQFNPVTGKVRVYTQVTFRLEFIGGEKSFKSIGEKNTIFYTKLLKRSVVNPESIPNGIPYKDINSKAGEKNYIIITHSNFLTAANNLANWKRQMGYSVEVVSQSSWTTTQVKTEIQTRYNNWTPKPDYFVIIGDNGDVPGETVNSRWSPYTAFRTDNYYSCMDGSSDYVPDMARGRISVSSSAEAITAVQKMIDYEYNPVDDATFYSTGLHCAQFQDYDDYNGYADRRFCQTSEEIRDYLLSNTSLTINRIYQTETAATPTNWNNGSYSAGEAIPSELLKANGFPWYDNNPLEETAIINEFNSGRFFILHRDHGYTGGIGWASPYFITSSINSLTNQTKQPVVFSINCHTGEYQVAECFAEKLIRKSNGGAVGVFGAAHASPSGLNDAFAMGLFDAIWSNPGITPNFTGTGGSQTPPDPHSDIYTLGDVLNHGLVRQVQTWNSGSDWNAFEHELMHYFGDPAMKIWTANPNDNAITATHASSIDCSLNSFGISNSTPGATATLVYNDELIGLTTLDVSGNGTIYYTISVSGFTATLTISKHDHKPYETSLSVTGSCSNKPEIVTNAATNVSAYSAACNGAITNDFGYPVTESGFIYSLSPNQFIGQPGVTKVQTYPTVTMGLFSVGLTGLTSNTTYYYRAYAINSNGTGYGDNEAFTTTYGTINVFPYTQNFNSWSMSSPAFICTADGSVPLIDCWTNVAGDDIDWDILTGATGSGNTGPSDDHTGGGNYLYTESSSCYSSTGYVTSPVFDLTSLATSTLTFWYHMYGAAMGAMSVQVSVNGGSTWSSNIWSLSGNQVNNWQEAIVSLTPYVSSSNVIIRFTGLTGLNYTSDMAIDDISITGVAPGLWTGTTSNDWGTTTNWDDGNIPSSGTDVTIPTSPSGGNFPETNSGAGAQCNNLTIESGAWFTNSSGINLSVGGNFTIEPTGSFIDNGTTSVTGQTIVQNYYTGSRWHFISSPVTLAVTNIFNNIYFKRWDEASQSWIFVTATNYGLAPGTGYEVWSTIGNPTINYVGGVLNSGNISPAVSAVSGTGTSQGWNFVGNPYPSAIDLGTSGNPLPGYTWSNLNSTVHLWNGTVYADYNPTTGAGNNSGTRYVPSMQGFFVKATSSSPAITIPTSAKEHNSQSNYKSSGEYPLVRLKAEGNGFSDETVIMSFPGATLNFDSEYDSYKLWGLEEVPQLYSFVSEDVLSINALPEINAQTIVPLGFQVGVDETYSINLEDTWQMEEFDFIMLEDMKEEIITNIKGQSPYYFSASPDDDVYRFNLYFTDITTNVKDLDMAEINIWSFHNNLYIYTPELDEYQLSVYDLMGHLVFESNIFNEGLTVIPMNTEAGYYFVTFTSEKVFSAKKVLLW
ncbi:MAG: hypothetical protein K8S16_00685 [Bacteroidales bacterium]|nr:hypothetical protein [Bacteroidales bacterium]